jgi:O-antigen/teichoic acid export membrane protein
MHFLQRVIRLRHDRLARAAALAIGSRGIGVVLSLVTGIVVARVFGAGGKGTLAYLVTALNLAVRAFSLGLESSFTRMHAVRKLPADLAAGCVVWTALMLGAVGAGLLNLMDWLMPVVFAGVPGALVTAFTWGTPALLLLFLLSFVMFGLRRELAYAGLDFLWKLGVLAVTIGAAAAARPSIISVGLGQMGVAVLVAIASILVLRHAVGGRLPWKPHLVGLMFRDARGVYAYNTIRYCVGYGGMILAAQWSGVAEAGVFSVAVGLGEAVTLVASSVNLAFYPSVAESQRPVAFTSRTTVRVMLLCTVAGCALLIAAFWFVPVLYGPEFTGAVSVFAILLPGVILFSGEQVISSLFIAAGRIRVGVVAMSAGAVLLPLLAAALVGSHGIVGIALACALSQTAAATIMGIAHARQATSSIGPSR